MGCLKSKSLWLQVTPFSKRHRWSSDSLEIALFATKVRTGEGIRGRSLYDWLWKRTRAGSQTSEFPFETGLWIY